MRDERNWRIAQPRRDVAGIDPAVARLSEMLVAVLSELTVIRERLDTIERLAERGGVFRQSEIDAFEPDADADAARNAIRKRQIQKVMRPLLEDTERDLARARASKAPARPRASNSKEPAP